MSFESLGLTPALVRALAERNYTAPTPIQAEAIPHVLAGHDLLGGAQTGTGKTAAFVLPLLQRLHESPNKADRRPRALILVPTRELAAQVHDSIRAYSKYQRVQTAVIYGGAGMQPQVDALRRGVDILVATPGRLIDHLERRSADLSGVNMLILDEADRMLDMGFLPAIKRILTKVPRDRQTLLFSATFEDELKKLAMEFMRTPKEVQIAARNTVNVSVSHRVHPVDQARKRDLLVDILSERWQDQILVFGKTKHGCNRLSEQLEKAGISSTAIHGNKSQSQRLRALADFKSGAKRVLVATDVAARGLDIPQLPLVINFDLPMVAEDYIHRIGRTGRAGATGEAISLVCAEEGLLLRAILRMLKVEIEMVEYPGYTPMKTIRLGNESPGTGRPAGNRAPQRRDAPGRGAPRGDAPRGDSPRGARRPHVNTPRHAHAGPKTHGTGGDAARRTGEVRR